MRDQLTKGTGVYLPKAPRKEETKDEDAMQVRIPAWHEC